MIDKERQKKKQVALSKYKRTGELGQCCSGCGWQMPFSINGDGLDIHHVKPVCKGGSDDISNLLLLCPNCHRVAHKFFHSSMRGMPDMDKQKLVEELRLLSENRNAFIDRHSLSANEILRDLD